MGWKLNALVFLFGVWALNTGALIIGIPILLYLFYRLWSNRQSRPGTRRPRWMCGFNPDGETRELVRLRVVWSLQGGERTEDVFANYYPGDRRAEVYLGRLDHDGGQFRLVCAERYGYVDFVKDFEERKLLSLENVTLRADGNVVRMDVDGRSIVLSECLLNTFGSMVNLRGKLGKGEPEIKFEYDGKSAVARFKGRPLIEYIQVQGASWRSGTPRARTRSTSTRWT